MNSPYKPAGYEAESWNSPLYTLQERLEICAGAVKFERDCGNNARKQRNELQTLVERLKQEAQTHAGEARTANATIAEIYQLCTGATGEPGNWSGAEPIRELISAHEAEVGRLMGDLRASEVAELGAQSANRHLSALVDFERQVSERCMAVMKALMDAAEPVNNEFQDCHIDYADYAKFVDAHAELLYVIKNGERPAALTQGETK